MMRRRSGTGPLSPVYRARYGWDLRTTGVVAISAVFTAVRDAGSTEIAPGSSTVVADHPVLR